MKRGGGRREDPICLHSPAPKRKLYIRCMVGHADFALDQPTSGLSFLADPKETVFWQAYPCWSMVTHSETISEQRALP